MTGSRSITLFDVSTAGLGLCALYCGLKWLKESYDLMALANTTDRVNAPLNQLACATSSMATNYGQDGGAMIAAMSQAIAAPGNAVAKRAKLLSAGTFAVSGLMLFSAYSAGNSFKTGKTMGAVAELTGILAAADVAYTLCKKI